MPKTVKTRSRTISLTLKGELLEILEEYANRMGMSLPSLVKLILVNNTKQLINGREE